MARKHPWLFLKGYTLIQKFNIIIYYLQPMLAYYSDLYIRSLIKVSNILRKSLEQTVEDINRFYYNIIRMYKL